MTSKTTSLRANVQLRPRQFSLLFGILLVAFALSCSDKRNTMLDKPGSAASSSKTPASVSLTSRAFQDNAELPSEYTCDGENRSPDLEWTGLPAETKSIALICEDPDAPGGTFTHWVVFDIPPGENSLSSSTPKSAVLANGARQGKNAFGNIGYGGPCPPRGWNHRYYFRIYALDTVLDVPGGSQRPEIELSLKSHRIGEGVLMGTYRRR